jgi:hypothetical protein
VPTSKRVINVNGSPIRARGQEIKRCRPRFFVSGFPGPNAVCSDRLGPVFSFPDFGCIQAIRSVTHLDLAPIRCSLFYFEPKGAGRRFCPGSLRLVSLGSFLLRPPPDIVKPLHCAQLRFAESRKHSVPGRVHSVSKNGGSPLLAPNPLVTHGTVESPANPAFQSVLNSSRAAGSNQSPGLLANPFIWLAAALPHSCGKIRFPS